MTDKIFSRLKSFSLAGMWPKLLSQCEVVQAQLTEAFEQHALPGNAYSVASATDSILSGHVLASSDELDILRELYPGQDLPDPYVKCPMCFRHFRMLKDGYYPLVE